VQRAEDATTLRLLNGSWRLLYSNAPEITNLARLPLGFELGPVYQPIDVAAGAFENQAAVAHRLGLATGSTRVVADFRPARLGTVNSAGIRNAAGNRIDVDFRRVVFALDRLLALSTDGRVRKVVSPTPDPTRPQPAVDVTYLDEDLRITRGGDASLFVLRREESPTPLLGPVARAALYAEDGAPVVAGAGLGNWSRSAGPGVIAGRGA